MTAIEKEEKRKIRAKLPHGYAKLVKKFLEGDGRSYSERTIKAVANGERENVYISLAIVKVAEAHENNKQEVSKKSKKLLK